MSLRHLLEEFPSGSKPSATTEDADLELRIEAARSEGYEAGYTSGWEDAVKAEREKRGHIDAEFERCIQDLGFTYHEATDQVRTELATFLSDLMDALFPAIVPDLLRETIQAEALGLAEGHLNPTVKLLASEQVIAQLQDMVPDSQLDLSIEVEGSLGPNQAFLSLAGQERLIDFQPLVETIRHQLGAMTEMAPPEALDE